MKGDTILRELVGVAERNPAAQLLQYARLAGAHQYLRLHRLFLRTVPRGAEVLDWGAGNGHFSYFLLRAGYRVTAFDVDEQDFDRPLPEGDYRYVQGSPKEPVALPFADASFDAVSSIGVLEHVRETGGTEEGSLREIARVLRPGGRFVCYHFPNRYSLIEAVSRKTRGKHSHPFRYTRADVRRLAKGAGLELLAAKRYGFLPRNSLGRLPRVIGNSRVAARVYDLLDDLLALPFRWICQNHLFVARKPEASD